MLKAFKTAISTDLDRRFIEDLKENSITAVASCMDPRHKGLKFLSSSLQFNVQEHVRSLISTLDVNASVASPNDGGVEEEPPVKKSAMTLLLGESYFDEQQTQRDEFTHYLEEPPLNPNGNPLKWWMVNEQRFPKVSCIARKYLCAPSTSVPSERVFSAAGNIVSKKRSSLLPENVNSLIFLNKNL